MQMSSASSIRDSQFRVLLTANLILSVTFRMQLACQLQRSPILSQSSLFDTFFGEKIKSFLESNWKFLSVPEFS